MSSIQLKQPFPICRNSFINFSIWMMALLGDYAIIVGAFCISYIFGGVSYPVVLLLLGIAQHRLSVLGHEGVHGLITKNRFINDWCAQILCFWPLLTDVLSYRKFHGDHHAHLGEEHYDPEHYMKGDKYHLPITRKRLFTNFFADIFGASWKEFLHVMKYFSKIDRWYWAPSFILLSGFVCYSIGHIEFFILFMLSKPTTFWAVFRLRIYTEHTDIPGTHRVQLTEWQQFLFSPHNIGVHWEHHNYSNVPFWQLPALRASIKDEPIMTFSELLNFNEQRQRSLAA